MRKCARRVWRTSNGGGRSPPDGEPVSCKWGAVRPRQTPSRVLRCLRGPRPRPRFPGQGRTGARGPRTPVQRQTSPTASAVSRECWRQRGADVLQRRGCFVGCSRQENQFDCRRPRERLQLSGAFRAQAADGHTPLLGLPPLLGLHNVRWVVSTELTVARLPLLHELARHEFAVPNANVICLVEGNANAGRKRDESYG